MVCDHASNHVPDFVNGGVLGVSQADMERHIAYDVGAAGVTREMARLFGCSALLSRFSRLVIDPNRGTDDPTLVMRLYDGSIIPANRSLTSDQIAERQQLLYEPYHQAVTAEIDRIETADLVPHLISMHSYTPQLRGRDLRPWHVGVLWDQDDRLAGPLIKALEAQPDLVVGDNQPYSGQLRGDSMYRHGTSRGVPHVLIEIRNDLIEDDAGQKTWAARLVDLLAPLIPVA